MRGSIIHPTIGTDQQKTVEILTKGDLSKVAKFVYDAFAHRDILIDVQSTILDIINKVELNCKGNPKFFGTRSNDGLRLNLYKTKPTFKVTKLSEDGLLVKFSKIK